MWYTKKMDGIFLVDKPQKLSSAAVVAQVKKRFKAKKVGHGGTLDPMATGLLPVALEEGTKVLPFLLGGDKEYIAEATLGASTDTDDAEGRILQTTPTAHLSEELVCTTLLQQRGVLSQKPPIYSALKRDGDPLYKLARQGKEVEVEPRKVEVKELEILSCALPIVRFRVACSKGTYIRSIARDLGEALGVGAHLSALRRTKVLPFSIEKAKPIDQLTEADLISCASALSFLPKVSVTPEIAKKVSQGQALSASFVGFSPSYSGFGCILTEQGELLAIVSLDGADTLTWERVLRTNP